MSSGTTCPLSWVNSCTQLTSYIPQACNDALRNEVTLEGHLETCSLLQVLGSSRGAELRGQESQLEAKEEESDPEELKKLLKLITDLGGF